MNVVCVVIKIVNCYVWGCFILDVIYIFFFSSDVKVEIDMCCFICLEI